MREAEAGLRKAMKCLKKYVDVENINLKNNIFATYGGLYVKIYLHHRPQWSQGSAKSCCGFTDTLYSG